MGEDERQPAQPQRRRWVRWILIVLGIALLALAVFHAPILRVIIHSVAQSYAARENLKLKFRLEGDPLDQLALFDVQAAATGPSAIQSLEAGAVKVDYSLWDLLFHGLSETLKNVEVHNLTAVIDSSKAPIPTPTPIPARQEQFNLPAFFPDRLVANNVNLTIKEPAREMTVEGFNIGLYPEREGRLQITKVQIPGVDPWTNINGTTTYADKNLYIHNLTLDQNARFETVNVNASKIGQGRLELGLKGTIGGGEINSQGEISTAGRGVNANASLQAKDISLGKLGRYLGQSPGQLSGDVKRVDLNLKGDLNKPASLDGSVQASFENVQARGVSLDQIKLKAEAHNGEAIIQEARIDQGTNHVELQGSIDLPNSTGDFAPRPGNLQFSIDAPNLQKLTSFVSPPASGSLRANGTIITGKNAMRVDARVTGEQIHWQNAAIENLSANLSAEKRLALPNDKRKAPLFEGLTSKVETQLSNVREGSLAIDQVRAHLTSDGVQVSLASLMVRDGNNILQANGSATLPGPGGTLMKQPADIQFTLNAPQLADFWASEAANKITGELQGKGQVQVHQGIANGEIRITGTQIAAQKVVVRHLNLEAAIANSILHLKDMTATINEQDYLHVEGGMQLQKPFQYNAKATAHLADLSAFEPMLNAGGPGSTPPATKTQLAGSLVLDWNGQGEVTSLKNIGDLHLRLEHGRYADLQKLEADVEAHYTGEELNVPIIYLGSDKLHFQAILQAKNSTLEISKIQIDQGEAKYASAYAALPFTWSNLGSERPLFPPNGKAQVNFQSENLDLARLFRDLGKEPLLSGQLSVKLDAQGPLDQLQANLNLQLQDLKAAAAKQLEPARINLATRLENNQLTVLGKIEQAKIQPVQIDARMPLNLSEMIASRKLDERTPITASVRMPRSSINFVREFVPALRQADGSMAININLDGTIARPVLSGTAETQINVARFENPTLPALTNFKSLLNFRDNILQFDHCGGDLAGGPFTVSGRITLPKLTEPNFDLHLVAKSVLVARNDNLTARADADLRVQGPMKAATVKGQVLTTNSRFFKNIDIIPIALPGRPPPRPEPPSAAPTLSIPQPPLRDWKFDIAIKSKDPFLIRGNLATGRAFIDLKLNGTGLHPALQGQVRLDNFEATLPFSTLTINLGFLYFDPDDPLNPHLEMQGTSLIRDYTIHVYVYGTATAPQAVFSSEPPLPQEEIISLLATGTTREELASGNVLASRAGILLVKQLYRKIFKKGPEPERNDSFFNRLDVEFGNTDPRTGEQTATARYKVNDQVVLIGDIGTQGGFRGLVKYLIRFR